MGSEPVERLAAETAEARSRISATIDEIQDRFDPRRIAGEAADKALGNSRQALNAVADTAREHPLAIGAGIVAIGLALLARKRLAEATVNLGDNLGAYTDYDDGFGFDESRAAALRSPDSVAAKRSLAVKTGAHVDSNPVISIILGLAAGAALGALFPSTDAERNLMGAAGDKLGDAARRAVDQIGKRA